MSPWEFRGNPTPVDAGRKFGGYGCGPRKNAPRDTRVHHYILLLLAPFASARLHRLHRIYFYGSFCNLLISGRREVLSFQVNPSVSLDVLMEFMNVGRGVALIVTREAVRNLIEFSFDISYVKVESGHVVHPSELPIRQSRLGLEEF